MAADYRRKEPEDVLQKVLGDTYTQREFDELAISRALEKRGRTTREIAKLIPAYLRSLRGSVEIST